MRRRINRPSALSADDSQNRLGAPYSDATAPESHTQGTALGLAAVQRRAEARTGHVGMSRQAHCHTGRQDAASFCALRSWRAGSSVALVAGGAAGRLRWRPLAPMPLAGDIAGRVTMVAVPSRAAIVVELHRKARVQFLPPHRSISTPADDPICHPPAPAAAQRAAAIPSPALGVPRSPGRHRAISRGHGG